MCPKTLYYIFGIKIKLNHWNNYNNVKIKIKTNIIIKHVL